MYVHLYRHSLLHPGCCSDYDVQHTFLSGYHTRIESQTRFVTHRYNRPSFGSSDRAVEPWDLLRAVVAHGERGEHKPRNGDRIHLCTVRTNMLYCLILYTQISHPSPLRRKIATNRRVLFLSKVPYNLYVESRLWMYRFGSSNPTSV